MTSRWLAFILNDTLTNDEIKQLKEDFQDGSTLSNKAAYRLLKKHTENRERRHKLMIVLMLKEEWQKDELLFWISENQTATEDEVLMKAIGITKMTR